MVMSVVHTSYRFFSSPFPLLTLRPPLSNDRLFSFLYGREHAARRQSSKSLWRPLGERRALSLPSPKSSNSGAKVASRRLLTKGEGRQEPLGAVHDLFGGEWLLIYIVNGVTPILCQNT